MFLDEPTIKKIRMQFAAGARNFEGPLMFLIMSGSFNPVHADHVFAFEIAKKYFENVGHTIIGGFLAPSSSEYVECKYGAEALSFAKRRSLCELAIEQLPWLSVTSKGELSSNHVRREVGRELEDSLSDVLKGIRLCGAEIMGSDTVLRIFGDTWPNGSRSTSTGRGRVIYWLLRAGSESATQRIEIETRIAPKVQKQGVMLVAIEPKLGQRSLAGINSSAIRQLASSGNWTVLRSRGWLAPKVVDALEAWALERA